MIINYGFIPTDCPRCNGAFINGVCCCPTDPGAAIEPAPDPTDGGGDSMARPRSENARRIVLTLRATPAEAARWRAAAVGMTLSEFLRQAADRDAAWAEDAAAAYQKRAPAPETESDYSQLSKAFDGLLGRARAGDVEALEALADASDRLLSAAASRV